MRLSAGKVIYKVLLVWVGVGAFLFLLTTAVINSAAKKPLMSQDDLEMVSSVGLLTSFWDLPASIPKITYLHLLQLLVLVTLAGQLLIAYRQKKEEYLFYILLTCGWLIIAYSLNAIYGVQASHSPAVLLWVLSILSSLSLIAAGLSAMDERLIGLVSLLKLLFTFFAALFLALALKAFLGFSPVYSAIPVAATSVTGCLICSNSFFSRARTYGGLLPWTLLLSFLFYGLIHLLEPLLYSDIVKPFSAEDIYLLSFLAKAVAFLAVVSLALVESHTGLKAEKEKLTDLLTRTQHALFRDSPDGTILLSNGEDRILGWSGTCPKNRKDIFADPDGYDRYMSALQSKGVISDYVTEFRHSSGSLRSVNLRAHFESGESGASIAGSYHDITQAEWKKNARELFDTVATRMADSGNLDEALRKAINFLESSLSAPVCIYLRSPHQDQASSVFQFILSASSPTCSWPGVLSDNILNLIRDEKIILVSSNDKVWGDYIKKSFALGNAASIVFLPFRHRSGEKAVGIVAAYLENSVRSELKVKLDVLADLIDQILVGIDLVAMKTLLAMSDLFWQQLVATDDLSTALRRSLQDLTQASPYAALFVVVNSEALALSKDEGLQPLIVASGLPTDHLVASSVRRFLYEQETASFSEETYTFLSPLPEEDGMPYAVAVMPLSTHQGVHPDCLVAVRTHLRSEGAPATALFTKYDQDFLSHLSRQIGTLITKFAASRSFRKAVGRVGHDLRAPIVAIRNRAHYLVKRLDELEPHVVRYKLEDIKSNAAELSVLAAQIDHFRTGTLRENLRETKIFNDVIQKCCKELRHMFLERQAVPPEPQYKDFSMLPTLLLRRSALDRVVQNLVVNAAKYGKDVTAKMRPLKIMASITLSHYVVHFQDWGRGIEAVEVDKIFEEGYRGKIIQELDVTGNGMGLFIARQLARDELEGDLILASRKDPTEFHLLLPRKG